MARYLKEDNPVNELPVQIKKFINIRIDIISLHLSKKLYQGISTLALSAILSFALLFFLFFGSYSFIMWYADYYGRPSTAAFIVAGFYLLVALVVYAFRKTIIYKPLKKSFFARMDFKEFHKDSIVGPINSDEDFVREMKKVEEKIDEIDRELDYLTEDIKEYYSFDEIKNRFIDDLFSNPKPVISSLMQGIMAFKAFRGRRKSKSKM
jgi:hypothetical protein